MDAATEKTGQSKPVVTSNSQQSQNPTQTPQQTTNSAPVTTNALEHLRLEFLTQPEMELFKRLCAPCIYQGVVQAIETKEEAISKEISQLNNKIWNYFSELMNEDCLNSAKPDQFLPMKNIMNINLISESMDAQNPLDETSSDQDLNKQLQDAFLEFYNGTAPQSLPASSSQIMAQPTLFKNSSFVSNYLSYQQQLQNQQATTHKKKSFGWSQTANTALKEQKKIQSIQQQIQECKNEKLRKDILSRIETDFLPSNRLHLEFTDVKNNMMNKTAFEERGGGGGAKEAGSGMNDFSPHCMGRGGKGDLETTTAEDQINQILMNRENALEARTDRQKVQQLAPNTQPHCQILQNSYLSDLDLGQISEHLDIEIAVMLDPQEALKDNKKSQPGQPQKLENNKNTDQTPPVNSTTDPATTTQILDVSKTTATQEAGGVAAKSSITNKEKDVVNGGQKSEKVGQEGETQNLVARELNFNCQYDFRPSNFNFLLLSRFSFATKRRRIQKLVRKRTQARKAQLKKSLLRVEDMESRVIESRSLQTQVENSMMETIYPKLYREYIETRVKKEELLHDQGLDLGRTGPAHFEHDPQHLDPQKAMKCQVTPSLGTLTAEIPDDVIRAKASYTSVPQPRYNQYTNQPIQISIQPRFKLIEDPMDYEMEYKRRNLWSVADIKTFLVELLRSPKRFEKIGEALPHKTASEIVFFYHTFKKLLKLKEEIKKSREYIKMRFSQQQQETSFRDLAETIMKPLTSLIENQQFQQLNGQSNLTFAQTLSQQPSGFNAQGYFENGNNNSVRGANATQSQSNSNNGQTKEAKRSENRFNIEQLLQVFSASNFNGITQRRRPPKGNLYASLHDHISLDQKPAMGLYPHDTYKIRPEFLGLPPSQPNTSVTAELPQQQQTQQKESNANAAETASPKGPTKSSSQADKKSASEVQDNTSTTAAKKSSRGINAAAGQTATEKNQGKKQQDQSQPRASSKDRATLQKVDYLEYLEQTGENVINLFLRNSSQISQQTSELRRQMSVQTPDFANLDNDSWRKVNYLSPQQQQIKTLLEHQRKLSQREAFVTQEAQNQEAKDGLHQIIVDAKQSAQVGKELKCKAHSRNMEYLNYWNYEYPTSTKTSKKKGSEGFTQNHFDKLEKKAENHQSRSKLQQSSAQMLKQHLLAQEQVYLHLVLAQAQQSQTAVVNGQYISQRCLNCAQCEVWALLSSLHNYTCPLSLNSSFCCGSRESGFLGNEWAISAQQARQALITDAIGSQSTSQQFWHDQQWQGSGYFQVN